MLSQEKSAIAEWYNGKTLFITGGTGFMGKVLVEKLLYSCSGIRCIYILMRAKRGKNPTTRVAEMWTLPLFSRLRESQPKAFEKIVPLEGDLDTKGLGLSEQHLNLLIENTQIILHCGATLKLDATLKDAVEQNTVGTARVIEIARKIKNLDVFVHFSTAYCSADVDVFEEKVYDCRDNPRDVIEVTRCLTEEALQKATPSIIAPHPNTYTYTKRLAEKLVAAEKDNMRVCIVRPSIVTPAALEPLPGWVDSLNGPMGLLVAAGKGVLRSMHAKSENKAQVIPVDIAINASIIIAQKLGSAKDKPKDVPVYNLTQDAVIPLTYGEILDKGRSIILDNPFEMQIWYPDGDIRSSKLVHDIYCIFLHWLPAYFIDFLLFLFRYRRFMVRLQRKIHDGLNLLQFFTVRPWIFTSQNFLDLEKELSDVDKKIFNINLKVMEIDEYMLVAVLGARQYLMKEDLSSLPRCRRKQKILYVLHKALLWGFYSFVFWKLYSCLTHFCFQASSF